MPLAAAQARNLSVFDGWSLCPRVKEGFCFHYETYLYFSLKGCLFWELSSGQQSLLHLVLFSQQFFFCVAWGPKALPQMQNTG